jgi:hypothetical protein
MMIYKFQGIYGTMFVVPMSSNNLDDLINETILKILEEKKLPYSDVYVKVPSLFFQKFLDVSSQKNLKYKDIEFKKQIFLVKY